MKCSMCNDAPVTIGDIRRCGRCSTDGTGQQIDPALPDTTNIGVLFGSIPGLANRFIGTDPVMAIEEPAIKPADQMVEGETEPPKTETKSDGEETKLAESETATDDPEEQQTGYNEQ